MINGLTKISVIIYLTTSGLNQGVKSFNFKTIYPRCFLDDKNHCTGSGRKTWRFL